jgi:dTDP-4-dehydrorhamnose 3,5-epimerase
MRTERDAKATNGPEMKSGHQLARAIPSGAGLTIAAAHERAVALREPVFVPIGVYADDRGWSMMNQLQGVMSAEGQINFSTQYPGIVKAWHRHARQADFWICLTGHVKVGVHRAENRRVCAMVIGERMPGVVVIPAGLWHGAATNGPQSAGLLYYVTRTYDASDPDEERMPFDAVPGFVWQAENR